MKFIKWGIAAILAASLLSSCSTTKVAVKQMEEKVQDPRIDGKLHGIDCTILKGTTNYTIENKKQYKKYSLFELKDAARMGAEKAAMDKGADGILNPTFTIEQLSKKKYRVTCHAKSYVIKGEQDFKASETNNNTNNNTNTTTPSNSETVE